MKFQNKTMLITYADSLGNSLSDLNAVLTKHLDGVVEGVHILPFYPSSADRGFAPLTYKQVDPAFGNWDDVSKISQDNYLMYDFMMNHISRSSEYFQDYLKHKDSSAYKDYFIKYSEFWPGGEPTQDQVDMIYKRKPRAPYILAEFEDGSTEKIWCTFDEEQIDLDIRKEDTLKFVKDMLVHLCENGASIIRIDAFAYVTKKVDTTCFFVEPDTWDILSYAKDIAAEYEVEILPEIHEHYTIQLKLAEKGYWIYDFALPMLVLHSLYSGQKERLINWLKLAPKKQFTTLDTHDGIGVVDVKDLMTDEEIEFTKESLYSKGANVKKIYNTTKYNNLDIYQINCTYYSALGDRDDAYLLARAIQFFSPGIPQVYYVGLLAGKNDIELLEKTKVGRNINRHYYSMDEIEEEVKRPVVQKLFDLMRFRNECNAFDGDMTIEETDTHDHLIIRWDHGSIFAKLDANLKSMEFEITFTDSDGNVKTKSY